MSLNEYRRRGTLLLGLLLLTILSAALPAAIIAGAAAILVKKGIFPVFAIKVVAGVVAAIGSLAAFFIGMVALLAAATDETCGFRQALARAREKALPVFRVSALYCFIVSGATLLLVVPGIVAAAWFFAAAFMALNGKATGMDAILRSRAMVRENFGRTLLVLFLACLFAGLLGGVAVLAPIAGGVFSILAAPLALVFLVTFYRNLEETCGDTPFPCGEGDKAKWLLLGLAGFIAVPVAVISVAGVAPIDLLVLKMGVPLLEQRIVTIPPPSYDPPMSLPRGTGVGGFGALGAVQIGPRPGIAPGTLTATDVSIRIFAVNASGTIRVNGREFSTWPPLPPQSIRTGQDVQYGFDAACDDFTIGNNTIDFEIAHHRGGGRAFPPQLDVTVYMGGSVVKEWLFNDFDGWRRTVSLEIKGEMTP